MLDIGASELLLTVIVAIVVIGPKDMPMALRTAGRWIGKVRRMSNHFRTGVEAIIREGELEEMERKWREQNEAIMRAHPATPDGFALPAPTSAEGAVPVGQGQPPAAETQGGQPSPARPPP
jgi:sec-independent protein translocase protein TatB